MRELGSILTIICTVLALAGCGSEASDDTPECGNGVVEVGETCDGDCPESCDDGEECTIDYLNGRLENCSVECVHLPVTQCRDADGCCPAGCNSYIDEDCQYICGNTVVEPGETCDPPSACPHPGDCDDGDGCTTDRLEGDPANCTASCVHTPVTECADGDGCCPDICDAFSDSDCGLCEKGYYPCPGGCCLWDIEIVEIAPLSRPGERIDVALDADGRPCAAYSFLGLLFKYAVQVDDFYGDWELHAVEFEGHEAWELSLVIDSLNRPHVAAWDWSSQSIKYVHLNDPDWIIEELRAVGDYVADPSIERPVSLAIDSGDQLHLAFYDESTQELYYGKNQAGAWSFSVVDGNEHAGVENYLIIDSADQPHIAYITRKAQAYQRRDGWIKYARLNGSWEIVTVTEIGAEHSNLSMDLDSLDQPHLVYATNRSLIYTALVNGEWVEESIPLADSMIIWPNMVLDSQDWPHIAFGNGSDYDYLRFSGSRWVHLVFHTQGGSKCSSLALDTLDVPYLVFQEPASMWVKFAGY